MRYAVVIEKAETNYSAYVPDLPGCVASGATLKQAEAEIREAIEFHIEGMRQDGLPIPKSPGVRSSTLTLRHSPAPTLSIADSKRSTRPTTYFSD